jgi:hypothetical protein
MQALGGNHSCFFAFHAKNFHRFLMAPYVFPFSFPEDFASYANIHAFVSHFNMENFIPLIKLVLTKSLLTVKEESPINPLCYVLQRGFDLGPDMAVPCFLCPLSISTIVNPFNKEFKASPLNLLANSNF